MFDRPLGAQISQMLQSRGVEVIFGIPGVHNQEMYRGIMGAGLTHVLARHEQGAGFMADGYARATGQPGVIFVITGPGLCNVMTPMGQAYSDRVPLLVLSSCLNRADLGMGRGRLHEMRDQAIAAGTVCDWSLTAQDASSTYQLIDRAFADFNAGRRQPKHIQVPIDVLEASAAGPRPPVTTIHAADKIDVQEVLTLLATAKRPLFIFGGGAVAASEAAQSVVAAAHAASFTTFAGNGIMPDDSPLHFGNSLARPGGVDVIAAADVVIAVGTALSEVDLWRNDLGHTGTLVRVDIDPAVLVDQQNATVQLQADAAAFLKAVSAGLEGKTAATLWSAAEVAAAREDWRREINSERPGLLPVIEALRAVLPDDTMIYSDMTQLAYAALEVMPMPRPGHWHHPHGFGTLGYALPAAIGGAIARKGAPTVAIAGDYGFQYTLQELMVAVERQLSLPIILWDNGKLGEIEDSMIAAQIAPHAVVQQNPDFIKFAESYGAAAIAPQSLVEMRTAIENALAHNGPTLIYLTPAIVA